MARRYKKHSYGLDGADDDGTLIMYGRCIRDELRWARAKKRMFRQDRGEDDVGWGCKGVCERGGGGACLDSEDVGLGLGLQMTAEEVIFLSCPRQQCPFYDRSCGSFGTFGREYSEQISGTILLHRRYVFPGEK